METAQRALGTGLVVSRLADILFVQAVRAYVDTLEAGQGQGLLAALADRHIGTALRRLHADVARNWTVDALASIAGMSRSAFAMQFKARLGQAPLDYLTRWRMFRAMHLLRQTRQPLIDVAASVGYASEAAFSKAFRRITGATPGACRRAAQQTA